MHMVVRLYINEDNERIKDPVWCLVDPGAYDAARTLCNGEVFGASEGNARGEVKKVKRGGITCPNCLQKLREYKAIKL